LEVALAGVFARRAAAVAGSGEGSELIERVEAGSIDPWSAAEQLLAGS
jgi:hypothetical protein